MSNSKTLNKLRRLSIVDKTDFTFNWHNILNYAYLENGDEQIIHSSGYFRVPPNADNEQIYEQIKKSVSIGIKQAHKLNNKFIIFVCSSSNSDEGYVMMCNFDMSGRNFICSKVMHMTINDGQIYCFPKSKMGQIIIFNSCGSFNRSISTNVDFPRGIIMKNDGTFLVCGHYNRIYATDKNGESPIEMSIISHYEDANNSYVETIFQLECGYCVLVLSIYCNPHGYQTKIYILDPSNLKALIVKHFNEPTTQVVCKENNRFKVQFKIANGFRVRNFVVDTVDLSLQHD